MTDKKLLKKKEKFIREITLPSGSHVLRVEIRQKGSRFTQNVQMKDFASPAAALAAAVRIRDQKLVEFQLAGKTEDLRTVKELYLRSYEIFPVRLKTRYRHDLYFKNVMQPYEDKAIQSLKRADIQESVNKFAETHTAAETKKMLAVWRRIYKTASFLELPVPDRSTGIVIPEGIVPVHREKTLSQSDLETFCEALLSYNEASIAGSYTNKAVYYGIRIMQFCGLRPAETFCLTRSDIDLEKQVIRVNKAVRSSRDELVSIGSTKTDKSSRWVPVPDQLVPILRECLEWCIHDDLLLADYQGELLEISWIDTLIGNVRKKCPGIRFNMYMLRHSFATDLIKAGVPLNVVRDAMGHEDSSMSLSYVTTQFEDIKKAMNSRKITLKSEEK